MSFIAFSLSYITNTIAKSAGRGRTLKKATMIICSLSATPSLVARMSLAIVLPAPWCRNTFIRPLSVIVGFMNNEVKP